MLLHGWLPALPLALADVLDARAIGLERVLDVRPLHQDIQLLLDSEQVGVLFLDEIFVADLASRARLRDHVFTTVDSRVLHALRALTPLDHLVLRSASVASLSDHLLPDLVFLHFFEEWAHDALSRRFTSSCIIGRLPLLPPWDEAIHVNPLRLRMDRFSRIHLLI